MRLSLDMVRFGVADLTQVRPGQSQSGELSLFPQALDLSKFYSSQSEAFALLLLALLILLVIVLSISRKTQTSFPRALSPLRTPKVSNLFLKVKLTLADGEVTHAYLRSLDLKEASFILAKNIPKGEKVQIELNSLPNFPLSDTIANGYIFSLRSFGGNPEKYLMRLRFEPFSEETKRPLLDYLLRLGDHPSPYQI